MEIDLEAIRKRNNEILNASDYPPNDDIHFTGNFDKILLNDNEEQFFDSDKNRELMMNEKRKVILQRIEKQKQFNDLKNNVGDGRKEQQEVDARNMDVKICREIAISRDRITEKYFRHIESTNMDDSSIICSLCEQFIFARNFYKHVDEHHHEYFYKIQTMNRQLFRNNSPVELNFPKQTEFDIEKHALGQIDHLAIYYSRAEHISTNSLLIHDIRPNESRRRLCLVHRMNELLESIKEKEKARKIQAQLKEDKKLLTQENKKRKKQGEPILLELPDKSKQSSIVSRHYHHRGRSGLVNLTSVQALALKNRDFLHHNKHYQPKVRSLKFGDSIKNKNRSEGDGDKEEASSNTKLKDKKCNKKFELVDFLNEHNKRTVMRNNSTSTTSLSFENDLKQSDKESKNANDKDEIHEPVKKQKCYDKSIDFNYQQKFEWNNFLSKNGMDDVFLEVVQEPFNEDIKVEENKQVYFGKVQISPAVQLISTCSHVQNRHLRRPKGDYLAKKLFKFKSSEPIFGYDEWSSPKNVLVQRFDWASAAVGKYFPKFKMNEKFMKFLFEKVRQFPDYSISRCVKVAILEGIADRKYFLSSNYIKDFAKVGQLRKAFRKLSRSEAKYEKYSKNGQRFSDDFDHKVLNDKISIESEKEPTFFKEFFDQDKIFQDENVDFSQLIDSLPFDVIDESASQVKAIIPDDHSVNENDEIFQIYKDKHSQIVLNNVGTMLRNLTKTLFTHFSGDFESFSKKICLENHPKVVKELVNIGCDSLKSGCEIDYPTLEAGLIHHLNLNCLNNFQNQTILSETTQIDEIPNLCSSEEEFLLSHSEYIQKILKLFDVELECDSFYETSEHDSYEIDKKNCDEDVIFEGYAECLSNCSSETIEISQSDDSEIQIESLDDEHSDKIPWKNAMKTLKDKTRTNNNRIYERNVYNISMANKPEIVEKTQKLQSKNILESTSKARLISPSFHNNISNVKMAQTVVPSIQQAGSSCKKVYIVKKGNQVAGILPVAPNQIKPGTVLIVPEKSNEKLSEKVQISRKLNKTDYDVPLGKIFKGPDHPNSNNSLHKYFTRSSEASKKRPISESSPPPTPPPLKNKPNINNSIKKNPINSSPIVESGPIPTQDSSFWNRSISDNSTSVARLSPFGYNFNVNKSPLREISQGSNRQNGSISSAHQSESIDSKEEYEHGVAIAANKEVNKYCLEKQSKSELVKS